MFTFSDPGYHGETPEDQLRVDMIVGCLEDFRKPLTEYARETDAALRVNTVYH